MDAPGIFTLEQRRAWRKVTDVVHAKGGYIFCQLWHVGRTTIPSLLGGRLPLSSSAKILEGGTVLFTSDGTVQPTVVPKEMTKQDLKDTIEDYVFAAKNAIEAGFDGIEIHSAVSTFIPGNLAHVLISPRMATSSTSSSAITSINAQTPTAALLRTAPASSLKSSMPSPLLSVPAAPVSGSAHSHPSRAPNPRTS